MIRGIRPPGAKDDPIVVVDDLLALRPELLLELGLEALEERELVHSLPLEHGARPEERTHERRALHAVPELGVGRLGRGEREPVQGPDPNPLLPNLPTGRLRK
jgi:hypothetical protein